MKKSILLAAAVLAFVPGVASAQFTGKTVNYQYYYPDLSSPYSGAANGNYVVGSGVEVSNVADNRATMDISSNTIFIQFLNASSWTAATYNGWVLSDLTNNLPAITGVTINGATNMAGFSASNISFNADAISVNWQNLSFTANTVVSLNVAFAGGAVPEPATWGMMILGFAVAGGALRQRRAAKIAYA